MVFKSQNQKRFFRQGKSGKWNDILTPKQVAQIEKDHGEIMEVCGYLGERREAVNA